MGRAASIVSAITKSVHIVKCANGHTTLEVHEDAGASGIPSLDAKKIVDEANAISVGRS